MINTLNIILFYMQKMALTIFQKRFNIIHMLKRHVLCVKDLVTVYVGLIRPLLEYAVPVWHPGLTEKQHYALERIQRSARGIILGTTSTIHIKMKL